MGMDLDLGIYLDIILALVLDLLMDMHLGMDNPQRVNLLPEQ